MKSVIPSLLASLLVLISSRAVAGPQGAPGTVKSSQKISALEGGFDGVLTGGVGAFGTAVAGLEDIDGDGVRDLVVGGGGDDDGGNAHGSVWVLFMNANGTVKSEQKISQTKGGFVGFLGDSTGGDQFGNAAASPGDLDEDGVGDLVVGAPLHDGLFGDVSAGSIWVVFLESDGTVKKQQQVSGSSGGMAGALGASEFFGSSVAALGDLDGDGTTDLAVGSPGNFDGGGFGTGAVWILFLNPDGTVKDKQRISETQGGFTGDLLPSGHFGGAVANLGDLDGDEIPDIAVGASQASDGGTYQGQVWILFLRSDGTVRSQQLINGTVGGFSGDVEAYDHFGQSLAALGDVNGDGVTDLAVGADGDDDGAVAVGDGISRGAVWILFLDTDGTVKGQQKLSSTQGGFGTQLDDLDGFGSCVGGLGDLNGDGVVDLAVSAWGDDDGGAAVGAQYILNLEGAVTSPWTDLGYGLAGTAGLPVLSGEGDLVAGQVVTLTLADALPFALSFLVISNQTLGAPFKGGILVPHPSIVFPITVNGFGDVSFAGAVAPGIPPAFTHYFQSWVLDPGGPAGLAASNALAGTTPSP